MPARQPTGPPPPPTVQRLRLRYAKRGPLRFTSHRDVARAFERALRRGNVPVAFSAGFSPHPKVSWIGAAPTGVASEAEYVEVGLSEACDPEAVRAAVDASLPPGLDVLECVVSSGGTFTERVPVSLWRLRLPGVPPVAAQAAVSAFLSASRVEVLRRTKDGTRPVDARAAVERLEIVDPARLEGADRTCVILEMVVRQTTPAVRPDDVLAGLCASAPLEPTAPAEATRIAQGEPVADGGLTDPLAPDRTAAALIGS